MLDKVVSFLTGAPVEKVAEYFANRQELKYELKQTKLEGKIELEKAKTQAKIQAAENTSNWELTQIKNSGWKDEFVLLTISYPVYGSFIPFLQDSIQQGFTIIGTTPTWYMGLVLTIYLAIYGVRWKYASEIPYKKD